MKKRIISLLLALILALSLLPVQTVVAEDAGSAAKSVVKNMQICLSVKYNGEQVNLTLNLHRNLPLTPTVHTQ